jgi:hypothetical protein
MSVALFSVIAVSFATDFDLEDKMNSNEAIRQWLPRAAFGIQFQVTSFQIPSLFQQQHNSREDGL